MSTGYYATVYSRWGEKVFDSRDDPNISNWDGYYKGKISPNQTFIYYIYYRGCDGNAKNAKGTVNPIR